MPDVSTLTLNNGVDLPALGLGVFQTPPEETRDAVTAALAPGYRHIDTAAAYGNERQVGEAIAASGLDRSEVFVETKIWISDYGYDQTLHGFEKSARKLGVDQIDLLILHQALPSAVRVDAGGVPGAGDAARRRKGPRHRRQQLHGRPPHRAARPGHRRPGGQPDRGPPLLPAARRAGVERRARHPHPGLVADRRHHLLPRRPALQHPAGPRDRRDRGGARQEPRAGDAALAPAAGPLGDPEVDQPGADRREHRRVRLRAHAPTNSPRSTPSTPASAAAPSPRPSPWRPSVDRSPRTEPLPVDGRRAIGRADPPAGARSCSGGCCSARALRRGWPRAPRPDTSGRPGPTPSEDTTTTLERRVLLAYFSRPGENYYYGGRRTSRSATPRFSPA